MEALAARGGNPTDRLLPTGSGVPAYSDQLCGL
jgi:hypothetical protein